MDLAVWSAALFTVLAQLSVGAFIVLGVFNVIGHLRYPNRVKNRLADPALYAIGPTIFVAMLAALPHVLRPLPRFNQAIFTPETILGTIFGILGFLFAIAQWKRISAARVRWLFAFVVAAVGIVFVAVMAHTYVAQNNPMWPGFTTPVQFFLTAIISGMLAVSFAFALYPWLRENQTYRRFIEKDPDGTSALLDAEVNRLLSSSIRVIGFISIGLIVVELVMLIFNALLGTYPRSMPIPMLIITAVLLLAGIGFDTAAITSVPKLGSSVLKPTARTLRSLLYVGATLALVWTALFIDRLYYFYAGIGQ
ncbi:dimethyl sulfoxide reductase anchor subunit [Gleimia hominis]|uniref:Dimethyl sulfoxide reductase anchor subunit n=1 Tax=Gleimia hominis TaxID=595468 RepID=A0ABU3IAJ2_9ACTO|nr:DmsC/YnfH family molybdoenzyme membrane anchor subunit [Gleimia hominis]MDT3767371.1 dimethyl sulfoxide reductase anchor subunit [Gleimia hominis]